MPTKESVIKTGKGVGRILLNGLSRFGEAAADNLSQGSILPSDPFGLSSTQPKPKTKAKVKKGGKKKMVAKKRTGKKAAKKSGKKSNRR